MTYKESVIKKLAKIQGEVLSMYVKALREAFPTKFTNLSEFCQVYVMYGSASHWITTNSALELSDTEMRILERVFMKCAQNCPEGALLTAYINYNSHNYGIGKLIMKMTGSNTDTFDFSGMREEGDRGNICQVQSVVPVCVNLDEAYEKIASRIPPLYAKSFLGIMNLPTLNEQF